MNIAIDFDLAERLAQAERDAGAGRAIAAVASRGSAICHDCGEHIEPARRKAAPFATRCLNCQQHSERECF
ncbi:MAG: TraR/DksA C4-type zinc finger protein [Paracoccus sp. (in: a-proteobacteria)]|nr:TraR/DksA C4-type zinc finger protein [Paracoccus sp. (in: a-proteobacteria)]